MASFDLNSVMRRSVLLLANTRREDADDVSNVDARERLKQQRRMLNERLGLSDKTDGISSLLGPEDVAPAKSKYTATINKVCQHSSPVFIHI